MKIPAGSSTASRAQFLSSAAAAFFASSSIMAFDPESCTAAETKAGSDNPRYIDKQLEMKYGEDSSKLLACCLAAGRLNERPVH